MTKQESGWPGRGEEWRNEGCETGVLAQLHAERATSFLCLVLISFILYLFISLISSEGCSVTRCSFPASLKRACLKSHIWKPLHPLFSCEWAHSMAGGLTNWAWRGWGRVTAALSGSTWALKGAWAGALIYHAGWWFSVRGLGAVCLSAGVIRGKKSKCKWISRDVSFWREWQWIKIQVGWTKKSDKAWCYFHSW